MVKENVKQIYVCKSYSKSHEKFDENKLFKLISANAASLKIIKLIAYNLSQPRQYFNILNLYKPGEILDVVFCNCEVM